MFAGSFVGNDGRFQQGAGQRGGGVGPWKRSGKSGPHQGICAAGDHGAGQALQRVATGDRIVARPSGTEPKIKFYFDVKSLPNQGESLADARGRGQARLDALRKAFVAAADKAAA